MISVKDIDVKHLARAVYAARNAMNSWDKSDSDIKNDVLGKNDLKLAQNLFDAGASHRKYLRQIAVIMDINAPLYWWAEFDTYKVGTVRNSCSKMHKLLSKPFEMSDFSFDKLTGYKVEVKQFVPELDEDMLEKEIWVRYDDDYDVSCYGRVKHNFKDHYRILGGSKHKDGYIFVTLHGKQIPLHRIVAKLFHSDTYREDLVVNHIDGNKQNNFASNLEWVTQQQNVKHSFENNLHPRLSSTYQGKFSQEERQSIKELWEYGNLSKREIAKKYNVSHTCINDIINDKYKYIDSVNLYEEYARPLVDTLNELRDAWLLEDDVEKKKQIWYSIIQLLPESYNQMSTVTMTYENIANILDQRSNHKLDEWREFCDILKTLPYVKDIMCREKPVRAVCFHCMKPTVVWQNDFTFEDMGYEGEGIVNVCKCANCGADIEYAVRFDDEEDDGNET